MHLNCDCENKLAYNVKYTRARLFKNITLLSYQINAQRYMKLKKVDRAYCVLYVSFSS